MNDKLLTKFILNYLIQKPEYLKLSGKQQRIAFETYKTIMTAIYQSIKHDNIFPVIVCGDLQARKTIKQALNSVKPVLPSIDKITVHLVQ